MYLLSITTYPNKQQEEDNYEKFQEEQDWYFSALSKNGQILINSCNTIFKEGNYVTYLLAPEQDSLASKNSNKYVEDFSVDLRKLCIDKPKIKLLGKSSDYDEACSCQSPAWYMLYCDINDSPVTCGDCGLSVPLYRLPKILGEDEYHKVCNWQRAYNACDTLFMKGIGERSAYQRLNNLSSDLTKFGREICSAFEEVTGKPFYYYLFRYYSSHKSTCPVCGELWKLEKDNAFIDYRCDNCKLVAEVVRK